MSRVNKALLAVLIVLLLVLAAVGGAIAGKTGLFAGGLGQPYNETRYSGTVALAGNTSEEPVPVVLVVRFHDNGRSGTLTSPTLRRHSELTRTEKGIYQETIVRGDGDSGGILEAHPGQNKTMTITYTPPGGAPTSAELPRTDSNDNAGEVGLNPDLDDTLEPDGIEFADGSFRSTGMVDYQDGPWEDHHYVDDDYLHRYVLDEDKIDDHASVVFRHDVEGGAGTVTYPDRQCYGTLEPTDGQGLAEVFTVGACESGGTWQFYSGDPSGGNARFTSADGTRIGHVSFSGTDWADIDGEVGLARSGPVLDYYKNLKNTAAGLGSCAVSEFEAVVEGWPSATDTVISYCDGTWATGGAAQTDWIEYFHFVDGEWSLLEGDGTMENGGSCFEHDRLRKDGAPDEFLDQVAQCR